MALKIYLADLMYDTVRANYAIPLNVACVAAYAKNKFGNDIEIEIFKYPSELEKRINNSPPDILGLSNYSWNERLNQVFVNLAKRLKPDVITVMGGPNIRTDRAGIEAYLSAGHMLDYYILFEGEEAFGNLVKHALWGGESPIGCASLINGQLHYEPIDTKKRPKQMDYPSPYLSGLLDDLLEDSNMIPLFETNRGCPFGCTYCAWGIEALAKVRCRPLETVFAELEYVAEKSAKQVTWYFCDANFGILKRDVEIAQKISQLMDKNGFPIDTVLFHSKNTSERNIEIARTIKDGLGYIAIQSTDPIVLSACGRGNIKFSHIKAQINYYKENKLGVLTDILIGLPNETAESHLKSLLDAFDMGFTKISICNIRMLPGSQYETDNDRKAYGVKSKFRPIFGAYGRYDGQNTFELDESVRSTKDMSESELDDFKILHWLIYFFWNMDFFKPILLFAKGNGINPGKVLHQLAHTDHPVLAGMFSKMKQQSMAEWFETKEEAVAFFQEQEHFDGIVHDFSKLTETWVAGVFQDANILSMFSHELVRIIESDKRIDTQETKGMTEALIKINNQLMCTDLLQDAFCYRDTVDGKVLSYVLDGDPAVANMDSVEIEIYRDEDDVSFCNYHLNKNNIKDFSVKSLTRFFEGGGAARVRNRIRVLG